MFAMITTEEYKELISAQIDADTYLIEFNKATKELKETKEALEALLLMIVKGEVVADRANGYKWFDLEGITEIAEYINKYHVSGGHLQLERVKENNDEQSN